MNIQLVLPTLAKLWFMSIGGLRAKTPLFGAFSEVCPKCHYLCLSGFFMVPNSNLQLPMPETSSFTRFGIWFASPATFRTENTLLGLSSDFCLKCRYVCLYSGFYGAEFKFTDPDT